MKKTPDRKGPDGQLLGPKRTSDWMAWRKARDNRIAKACKPKAPAGKDKSGG